jgi:hypothetical protein
MMGQQNSHTQENLREKCNIKILKILAKDVKELTVIVPP